MIPKAESPPPAGSIGAWKIDRDEPAPPAPGRNLLWHSAFVVHDDGTLSVLLLALSPRGDEPEDGAYRVRTRWKNETLFYELPSGLEVELAAFRNGRFEMDGDGERRLYRRVEPSELLSVEYPLLDATRPVYR